MSIDRQITSIPGDKDGNLNFTFPTLGEMKTTKKSFNHHSPHIGNNMTQSKAFLTTGISIQSDYQSDLAQMQRRISCVHSKKLSNIIVRKFDHAFSELSE